MKLLVSQENGKQSPRAIKAHVLPHTLQSKKEALGLNQHQQTFPGMTRPYLAT